ncbi:hypothetical protein R6Q57_024946 [Mikania cordata]
MIAIENEILETINREEEFATRMLGELHESWWRRVDNLHDEINQWKKQDESQPELEPSLLQLQIQQLSEDRKELIKGQYRDKHFNACSMLLRFGVFESIGGGVNTYLRTGKLFLGHHLYTRAGI